MTTDCVLHTTYHPRTTYQALVLDIRHHGGIADTECSRLLDLIAQQAHALPLPHAPCPMPHAQCPMPDARCLIPNPRCPMPKYAQSYDLTQVHGGYAHPEGDMGGESGLLERLHV